jgi:exonuclease SbcD
MKILHFADLHLGVENYGRTNPETGLSSRLEDFLRAFDEMVDYAIDEKVDLVLFCGDAYKSREPSQTQQREFARRIKRLAAGGIPVFLLVGNHDLPGAIGGATTPEIFATLEVDNVYVARRPDIFSIPTPAGFVQVVSLPWPRRSALLVKEATKNLTPDEINLKLQAALTESVSGLAEKLDPAQPAVLAAHVWVQGASAGSERAMTLGQDPVMLVSSVALPVFDYVALGHIHKHQVLHESPPVVYSGSLERVDFGEAADDKGFCLVEIDTAVSPRTVAWRFHAIAGRPFLDIEVSLEDDDPDPTAAVLQAISEYEGRLEGAIARLQINLPASLEGSLDDTRLRQAARPAQYFAISKSVRRETRLRLGSAAVAELTPREALQKYLETRQDLSKEKIRLLSEHGETLIQQNS